MSKLRRGDIVLVPFPFTHLKAQKVRPAIVISPKISVRGDFVAAFISSVLSFEPSEYAYVLELTNPAFRPTGLKVSSVFRMDKLVTLLMSMVLRQLGHAPPSPLRKLDRCLAKAVGLVTS